MGEFVQVDFFLDDGDAVFLAKREDAFAAGAREDVGKRSRVEGVVLDEEGVGTGALGEATVVVHE